MANRSRTPRTQEPPMNSAIAVHNENINALKPETSDTMKNKFVTTRSSMLLLLMTLVFTGWTTVKSDAAVRKTISLDGTWQIAEGKMNQPPTTFDRTVPVPGLVSLATPPFDAPGPKVAKVRSIPQKDPKRDAFWYRREFTLDGPVPAVARLKVAKAMFGTRVFLNGTLLGDHLPSFTPGYFDAKPAIKTGMNEVLIDRLVEVADARPQRGQETLGAERCDASILGRVGRAARQARHALRIDVAAGSPSCVSIRGREGRPGRSRVGRGVLSAARGLV